MDQTMIPRRVMPFFIERARNNETLTVKGHSNQLDFTHVDDVVAGIILGMSSTENRVYNISYGKAVHLRKCRQVYLRESWQWHS